MSIPAENAPKHVHPALFGLLVMPFGLAVGYGTVAVPFILRNRGLEMGTIATISALALGPHAWKFLWAPALDAGWRRRSWYLGCIAVAAAALAGTTFIDPDPNARIGPLAAITLYAIVLGIAQAAVATSSAALDALMAITLPDDKKGAASGWYNAGNLGGTGVGGALALYFAQNLAPLTTALLLAGFCVACGLPALLIHEDRPEKHPLGRAFLNLLKDLWVTIKSREGWTGLVICLSPVGTGAATQLFSAIARDYGAGERHVEVVNGILGGLIGAVGCLVGGYLADRMNRRLCYVLAGAFTALCAVVMALAPLTPAGFTVGCLTYSFANGIAYAVFTAFVLEMIGHGPGVTTKYALFVSCSNQAISYVTWLDGKGYEWGKGQSFGGRVGLLGTEVLVTMIGISVLGMMFLYLRRTDRRGVEAAAKPA